MAEKSIVNTIKKVDWQYLVNRRESPLLKSITDSSEVYFKKVTGVNWQARYRLRNGEGDIWYSQTNLDELRKVFYDGGLTALSNYRKKLVEVVDKFDKLAKSTEKKDLANLDKKALPSLAKNFFLQALYAHCFLTATAIADGVISRMIKEHLPAADEHKDKLLAQLTFVEKENSHVKEERDFYRLVQNRKSRSFERLLQKHLQKYAWIGTRGYFWDRAWTKKDLLQRVQAFTAQKKNAGAELKHLDSLRKKQFAENLRLMKRLKIKKSSELYRLIKLAREFAYLRTWRTDVMYSAGCHAQNMFEEIAKRSSARLANMYYLVWPEVIQSAKTGKYAISAQELKNRRRYFADFYDHGKYFVLSGSRWKKKLSKLAPSPREKGDQVRGNTAYGGIVKGRVKIVFSGLDLGKVKTGDILVAVMTFPNFVPAMEKAAAFVTDEGGILCHAAIVSREMRKPCIIATKVATKVFKDNDMVEVDANKGIVKRL